jgi:hypothetical protein
MKEFYELIAAAAFSISVALFLSIGVTRCKTGMGPDGQYQSLNYRIEQLEAKTR